MSQITRCPSCSTTFRVVADQLRISEGWVRCGHCKNIFDAAAHLLEPVASVQPPMAPAPGMPNEGAAAPAVPQDVAAPVAERSPSPPPPPPWGELQIRIPASVPTGILQTAAPAGPALPLAAFEGPAAVEPLHATDEVRPVPERDAGAAGDASLPEQYRHTMVPMQEGLHPSGVSLTGQPDAASAVADGTVCDPMVPVLALPPRRAANAVDPVTGVGAIPDASVQLADNADADDALPRLDFISVPSHLEAAAAVADRDMPELASDAESPALVAVVPAESAKVLSDGGAQVQAEMPAETKTESEPVPPQFDVLAVRPADDAVPEVGFVRAAKRQASWRRPAVRWVLSAVAFTALLGLAVQMVLHERDRIAARFPAARPALAALCTPFSCELAPLRQIEHMLIDSSSFNKARGDGYQLSMTLKSRSTLPLAMPAVELTLTDAQDQVVLRKVLLPQDMAAPQEMPALGEWTAAVALVVTTGGDRVAGYRLLAFYP